MAFDRLHQVFESKLRTEPERLCLIDHDGQHFSRAQTLAAIDWAEQRLLQAGLRPGDRLLLIGENAVAMCAFIFACSRLDAWVIPVNARQSSAELERIIQHAEPRALVFISGISAAAAAHAEHFAASPKEDTAIGQLRLCAARDTQPEPVSADPAEQVAAMFYTTGTTGEPKGVMLSHANLIFMAQASAAVRGLNDQDRLYCCIPVTHIYAFSSAMLSTLCCGAELQFSSRFSPEHTFQALRDGISCMPAVPAMYAQLMEHAETLGLQRIDAPRLRYIAAGGAPLDPDWKARVERFFGLTLQNGYGMTEASPGISVTRYGSDPADQACGPPLPGTEIKLATPPQGDKPSAGVGEVLVRGPHVMKGYFRAPEATRETLDAEGFLHTGDLGRWTTDGCLEIVGRCKELIIRSGFNVYPPEVETALNSHPAVTQSAVVGRTVQGGNEEVLAFVQQVPGEQLSAKDLQAWTRQQLAPYKVPSFVVITDLLPAAPSGKPLKHLMIEHFKNALNELAAGEEQSLR